MANNQRTIQALQAEDRNKAQTIDLSPSWEAAAAIYAACLERGTSEGLWTARRAVSDMGVLLDRLAAHDPELFTQLRKGLSI